MDEAAARLWLEARVSRETLARLEHLVGLLRAENTRQNLVSRASLDAVWARHIVDSAQLIELAPDPIGRWVDLGTGAGFPGLVVAALHEGPVTLIESRRRRAEFLTGVAAELGLGMVEVVQADIARLAARPFDVISARAFAPLDRTLDLGVRFSTAGTRWLLPKGRNAKSELEAAESSWQGRFRLEPSVTDADAQIIVAEGVRRAGGDRQ